MCRRSNATVREAPRLHFEHLRKLTPWQRDSFAEKYSGTELYSCTEGQEFFAGFLEWNAIGGHLRRFDFEEDLRDF
jgi:hypothetical protein